MRLLGLVDHFDLQLSDEAGRLRGAQGFYAMMVFGHLLFGALLVVIPHQVLVTNLCSSGMSHATLFKLMPDPSPVTCHLSARWPLVSGWRPGSPSSVQGRPWFVLVIY